MGKCPFIQTQDSIARFEASGINGLSQEMFCHVVGFFMLLQDTLDTATSPKSKQILQHPPSACLLFDRGADDLARKIAARSVMKGLRSVSATMQKH